jgi:protein-tyrosine phosphatase
MAAKHWQDQGKSFPKDYKSKFHSMATFCSEHEASTVPDPYYGGAQGFENVLDLLDDACTGLLKHIQESPQRMLISGSGTSQ